MLHSVHLFCQHVQNRGSVEDQQLVVGLLALLENRQGMNLGALRVGKLSEKILHSGEIFGHPVEPGLHLESELFECIEELVLVDLALLEVLVDFLINEYLDLVQ